MRKKILSLLFPEQHFKHVIATNMSNLFKVTLFTIPISVIHVVAFVFFVNPQTISEINWRLGIIIAHSLIIVVACIISFTILVLKNYKKEKTILNLITLLVSVFFIMFIGIWIVVIDQSVTSSISAFIIIYMATSVVFLMPPLLGGLVYSLVYGVFYIVMGIVVQNSNVLLSHRFDGFTALIMAIALSNILWFYFTNYESHKLQIQEQNQSLEQQKLELEQLNYRLGVIASMDSMTQLLNRREFEIQVNTEMNVFREEGFSSSMVIVDIDQFKVVNDTYGHPVGDELLKQFSLLLKAVLRDKDLIARWGGEEFVIMIHETNPNDAFKIAERLRKKIENTTFHVKEHDIRITASFGIAPLNSTDEEPLYTSYLKADKALYLAKDYGRNKTVIYTPMERYNEPS
ncbi:MAG: diguanylate cyclase [Erysipelothrix sp.]|nr:diguanylate cyclase [Erysipelothrix sp.]